jgi:hypothetical protein
MRQFVVDTCYRISAFKEGFTASIKMHRWVLEAPTCTFLIVSLGSFYYARAFYVSNVRCFSL